MKEVKPSTKAIAEALADTGNFPKTTMSEVQDWLDEAGIKIRATKERIGTARHWLKVHEPKNPRAGAPARVNGQGSEGVDKILTFADVSAARDLARRLGVGQAVKLVKAVGE